MRYGMGRSVHETTFGAGEAQRTCYRNHRESAHRVAGQGAIEDLSEGGVYRIAPGTLCALDNHPEHILRARTDLTLVCVFTPAPVGPQTHGELGAYSLLDDEGHLIRQ